MVVRRHALLLVAASFAAALVVGGCLLDWSDPDLPAIPTGDGGAGSGGAVSGVGGNALANTGAGGASECGDGIIQAGEECDGGPSGAEGCVDCRVVCDCIYECELEVIAFVRPEDNHCYLSRKEKGGWSNALAFCDLNLMRLAAVTTPDEVAYVVTKLQSGVNSSWIGATDEAVEGTFEWIDPTEPWTAVNDTMWISGEPSGAVANEDYVALNRALMGFSDHSPGSGHSVLCERRPPGVATP